MLRRPVESAANSRHTQYVSVSVDIPSVTNPSIGVDYGNGLPRGGLWCDDAKVPNDSSWRLVGGLDSDALRDLLTELLAVIVDLR